MHLKFVSTAQYLLQDVRAQTYSQAFDSAKVDTDACKLSRCATFARLSDVNDLEIAEDVLAVILLARKEPIPSAAIHRDSRVRALLGLGCMLVFDLLARQRTQWPRACTAQGN